MRTIRCIASFLAFILASCAPAPSTAPAPVLLFTGTGTTPNGVKAIQAILDDSQLKYITVNSDQLNLMTESQLLSHRLMIIPGGNYITIGNSLNAETSTNIQNAVQNGLNYLGICAGALLAGDAPSNSLNLTSGARFGFYTKVNQGIHKAAVPIAGVGPTPVEHYWEDGPEFTGWGAVVGKYPDGTPAIVEGTSGKGWVVLCGVHPEAPESWRHGMTFATPAAVANAYAKTLIDAAMHRKSLPRY
jgi:glutamine amidotransferase-like uncharacterized protein